jgi:hypothetical protein
LKVNKVNLFVSSVLFVFWYHSPNVLDTPRMLFPYIKVYCNTFVLCTGRLIMFSVNTNIYNKKTTGKLNKCFTARDVRFVHHG